MENNLENYVLTCIMTLSVLTLQESTDRVSQFKLKCNFKPLLNLLYLQNRTNYIFTIITTLRWFDKIKVVEKILNKQMFKSFTFAPALLKD